MKTELIFILDKSGSMGGLEQDTIGGFNGMLEKQKQGEGKCKVSTVLFNHESKVIHNRVSIDEVKHLTNEDYYVGGSTALLDAVGSSIRYIRHQYADTLKEERPDNVIFVITTDGQENSSREFGYSQVQKLIQQSKEQYGFEFLFLGANIDAIGEASKLGITNDRAVKYHSDKRGTKMNYEVLGEEILYARSNRRLRDGWKKEIEKDYKAR
jgi:uncharacterized protein YegL